LRPLHPDIAGAMEGFEKRKKPAVRRKLRSGDLRIAEDELAVDDWGNPIGCAFMRRRRRRSGRLSLCDAVGRSQEHCDSEGTPLVALEHRILLSDLSEDERSYHSVATSSVIRCCAAREGGPEAEQAALGRESLGEITVQLETMYSELDDQVATLVLNRPHVLNCASEQWARDLNTLADDLAANETIRVVVVRGAGRAFCSGIDLTALAKGAIGMSFFRNWESALRKLEAMDSIVMAAIQSHCIGCGLQVSLACDLRVARDDARFGITAVKEGIIPGIGMWRVARHAGLGRAKRLALVADVVDATTALDWGLVDWVVGADAFES